MNPSSVFLFIFSIIMPSTMAARLDADNTSGRQDFLDAHNRARAEVGVPALVWDDKVARYAENYARRRYKDCALEHSKGPYGENLAEGVGLSAADAVAMWVGEKSNYNPRSNSCNGGECLHYTQVVWKDSARLGCARLQCRNEWMFVTCNYDPPGNYIGERPY